jgi:hypothetical protein
MKRFFPAVFLLHHNRSKLTVIAHEYADYQNAEVGFGRAQPNTGKDYKSRQPLGRRS